MGDNDGIVKLTAREISARSGDAAREETGTDAQRVEAAPSAAHPLQPHTTSNADDASPLTHSLALTEGGPNHHRVDGEHEDCVPCASDSSPRSSSVTDTLGSERTSDETAAFGQALSDFVETNLAGWPPQPHVAQRDSSTAFPLPFPRDSSAFVLSDAEDPAHDSRMQSLLELRALVGELEEMTARISREELPDPSTPPRVHEDELPCTADMQMILQTIDADSLDEWDRSLERRARGSGIWQMSCSPAAAFAGEDAPSAIPFPRGRSYEGPNMFKELPDEIVTLIFSFLDMASLVNAAQVCRQFRRASVADEIWRTMYYERQAEPCAALPDPPRAPLVLDSALLPPAVPRANEFKRAALRAESSLVYVWGYESHSMDTLYREPVHSSASRGAISVAHVFAGGSSCGIVDAERNLWMWGDNTHGQLGIPQARSCAVPTRVAFPSAHSIRTVGCGKWHAVAVSDRGEAFSFGTGEFGALGLGRACISTTVPTLLDTLCEDNLCIVAAACGANHSVLLTENGQVYVCGANDVSQLGIRDGNDRYYPEHLASLRESICQISCGLNHSVALAVEGSVYTWGYGIDGQLGHKYRSNADYLLAGAARDAQRGPLEDDLDSDDDDGCEICTEAPVPRKLLFFSGGRVKKVNAGSNHTAFLLHDGRVFVCGNPVYYELWHGLDSEEARQYLHRQPRQVYIPGRCVDISCGQLRTFVVTDHGEVFAWGWNEYGQLGIGSQDDAFSPQLIKTLKIKDHQCVTSIACGDEHTLCAITARS